MYRVTNHFPSDRIALILYLKMCFCFCPNYYLKTMIWHYYCLKYIYLCLSVCVCVLLLFQKCKLTDEGCLEFILFEANLCLVMIKQ
ncbi:MAG: hypothetical protein B1H11_11465 [Desulfobacteraceae bacterium 4484_190.1]|nr:MAG: hypothetical protein B1H11_11465 [Desulfobacteraceae bacterium 4484_190.1]